MKTYPKTWESYIEAQKNGDSYKSIASSLKMSKMYCVVCGQVENLWYHYKSQKNMVLVLRWQHKPSLNWPDKTKLILLLHWKILKNLSNMAVLQWTSSKYSALCIKYLWACGKNEVIFLWKITCFRLPNSLFRFLNKNKKRMP